MAGQATGGQKLTPNRNVSAPAGIGGSLWGANGGGITPIGGGVSGQTGWDAPVAQTASDGETATNTIASSPGFFQNQSLLTREVTGNAPSPLPSGMQIPGSQKDSSINGWNNVG